MSTRRTKKLLNKNYKIHISKTREWKKKQQQPERDNEWKNHNKNNNYSAKEKNINNKWRNAEKGKSKTYKSSSDNITTRYTHSTLYTKRKPDWLSETILRIRTRSGSNSEDPDEDAKMTTLYMWQTLYNQRNYYIFP